MPTRSYYIMTIKFNTKDANDHIDLLDKIPVHLLKEDPVTETYSLGTVEISKGEYANSEKINELIEVVNKIIPKVNLQ